LNREWIEAQRRHFDRELADYSVMYGTDTPFHLAMTKRLFDLADPQVGERVLDLGCGVGRTTIGLLQAGCQVTGLDISQPSLDTLAEKVGQMGLSERFRPLCLAAEQVDQAGGFDLVIGRGFFHHLKDPAAVLARVHTALAEGGRVVFMDPNPLQPAWIPLHLFHPTLSIWMERYLWRGFPHRTCKFLEQAGFSNVTSLFAGLVPPPLWGRLSQAGNLERLLVSVPGLKKLALYLMVRGRK